MSRFDYDVNPLDGWNIGTQGGRPTFRTVWGMEYPELALEESLAFHDRRVRDTNLDPTMELRFQGGTFRDDDPDQWRVPQGSLYLELRSTRSPDYLREPANDLDPVAQSWAVPASLYAQVDIDPNPTSSTYEYMLDLARVAPDRNPVWRVAITRAHPSPAAVGASDPELSGDEMLQPVGSAQSAFTAPPDRLTATLQPEMPKLFWPQN